MKTDDMTYEVTKVEKHPEGFMVTVKDTNPVKLKHRNYSAVMPDASMFPVGSMVRVHFIPA